MNKRALVFGASGVSGWSFINELLQDYPKYGIWEEIVAMTNRPLNLKDSCWPADSRLQIVSGVDLCQPAKVIEMLMKETVKNVDKITHVYYCAYKASTDVQRQLEDAVSMFTGCITAMDNLSMALEFVVLQTGSKIYGCHLLANHPTDYIHVPLSEEQPRLKDDTLFYHPQIDWISQYSHGKKWSWCETRPDILVGFVPNQNFASLATLLGIFLSLFVAVEGKGSDCPFPGSPKSWVCKSNDSSADMVARQSIHLSLYLPKEMKGESFNVADAREYQTWSAKWPQLCSYFGLNGVAPLEVDGIEVRSYIDKNLTKWKNLEQQHNLKSGIANSDLAFPGFEYFLLTLLDFDRHYNMTKTYASPKGSLFVEERSVMQAWGGVFDRMKAGRLIPNDSTQAPNLEA